MESPPTGQPAPPAPTSPFAQSPGRRFGELCIQLYFASTEQVKQGLEEQRRLADEGQTMMFGQTMVRLGLLRPHQIPVVLAEQGIEVAVCPTCNLSYNLPQATPRELRKCMTCGGTLYRTELSASTAPPPPPDLLGGGAPAAPAAPVASGPAVPDLVAAARPGQQAADVAEAGELPPEEILDEEDSLIVGGYRVIQRLGTDARSTLYQAEDVENGEVVALKVMDREWAEEDAFIHQFITATDRGALLEHPHVQKIIDINVEGNYLFFVLEFIEGQSLRRIIENEGPFAVPVAMEVVRQLTSALKQGHIYGVLHREVVPANVLIDTEGKVRLCGFGTVRDAVENVEYLCRRYGTVPFYLAPEQAVRGKEIDNRTDIYSLGATFYHMLTGRPPYQGSSPLEVLLHFEQDELVEPIALRPDLPKRINDIVLRLMAQAPEARYQSCDEILLELHLTPTIDAVSSLAAEINRLRDEVQTAVKKGRGRRYMSRFTSTTSRRKPPDDRGGRGDRGPRDRGR